MPRELSLLVVGLAHPNKDKSNRKFEALTCKPGEPVHLVPEPKNKVDPHAIAVLSARGVQIGYVTGERCQWIGSILGRGEEVTAIFQSVESTTAVVRVAIGGGAPTLPPPSSSPTRPRPPDYDETEPGWYPDEIPPDDVFE